MTALLLTTNAGLEDIVEEEFRELADPEGLEYGDIEQKPFDHDGQVRIPTDEPADRVVPVARQMRSIHHVLRYIQTFAFDPDDPKGSIYAEVKAQEIPEVEQARAFRVTSNRHGQHDFTSMDVQNWAGQAVVDHYGTDVDLEEYDADVRVDIFQDLCMVGIQYTRRALSKRQPYRFNPSVSLKTNVSYAMLRLAHIDEHEPQVLLDPFCGAGTIPVEAAELYPEMIIHGSDWWGPAVEGSRKNAEAADLADRITFEEVDARELVDHHGSESVDLIVTNPPYGLKLGEELNFNYFYRAILDQFAEVLRPGGRIVMLVSKRGTFRGALGDVSALDVRHVRIVETGGVYPGVFVLQKREAY